MGWDEKIFRWGLEKAQRLLSKDVQIGPEGPHAALLSELQPQLKVLASMLLGRSVEVKEAETVGGASGNTIFLPQFIDFAPDHAGNAEAYLYRTVYSSLILELGITLPTAHVDPTVEQALVSATHASGQIRKLIYDRYPGLISIETKLMSLAQQGTENLPTASRSAVSPLLILWGRLLPAPQIFSANAVTRGEAPTRAAESLPTGTERKAKPKEFVEEVKLKEDREGENPLVHAFEKVRTVDDYQGGRKMMDGSDELEEQLEALQELDMRKIIRTRERTDSLYRADVMLDSGAGDLEDSAQEELANFNYPEWDFGARAYKKDWCKVFIDPSLQIPPTDVTRQYLREAKLRNMKQICDLKRKFEAFVQARRWQNRQAEGPEIDIDAVVEWHARVRSGTPGKENLYLAQRPRDRDFATLVLLDSSLSTDSWMQNRRVMDVLKDSMLILGEVIEDFHDRLAIGAFYSNTRKDCRYLEIKKFEETWGHAQNKLVALRPMGYTRIGPAIRHGTELLRKVNARKKVLLLISDGKPTDYDRYEGRYGIEDIRQAIREGAQDHVAVRALAIESQAKFYLPQMFGTGNYQILPKPEMLAESLAEIYGWLSV